MIRSMRKRIRCFFYLQKNIRGHPIPPAGDHNEALEKANTNRNNFFGHVNSYRNKLLGSSEQLNKNGFYGTNGPITASKLSEQLERHKNPGTTDHHPASIHDQLQDEEGTDTFYGVNGDR